MKIFLSILGLLVLVSALIAVIAYDQDKMFFGDPVYKETTIGMDSQAFAKLCGEPGEADTYKEISRDKSLISDITYKGSPERFKKKCYGTFRFENGKLTSIAP